MVTSKEDIRAWLKQGQTKNATHMLVVVDEFDYEDYPVYVQENQNVKDVYDYYNLKNMQRVMEVYNLFKDLETQLNKKRSFEF